MDVAQIQLVPVDNGFLIQCVNADGSGAGNVRRIAKDREDLVTQVKEIADMLYTKEPVKAQPPQRPAAPPPTAS